MALHHMAVATPAERREMLAAYFTWSDAMFGQRHADAEREGRKPYPPPERYLCTLGFSPVAAVANALKDDGRAAG